MQEQRWSEVAIPDCYWSEMQAVDWMVRLRASGLLIRRFDRFALLMNFTLQPWQPYLVILAGWVHRQQQFVIEHLVTKNKVLRENIGK